MITRKRPNKGDKSKSEETSKRSKLKKIHPQAPNLKITLAVPESRTRTTSTSNHIELVCSVSDGANVTNGKMSGGFSGLSETCNLSRRQASILSKRRAAEELLLAKQQELEAEHEAECSKKSKRDHAPPPPWTESDKDIFFQGVLACGRDFDKIHKFCAAKMKTRDLGERSKDQIRHFYYRTVKNVQSVVSMKVVSKNKEANELFAVVNWAEFRRRIGSKLSILTRHSERLNQLIYTGETKFKHKGKLVKIRTPVCAPLNRLIEKAKEDSNLDAGTQAAADKRKAAAATKKAKVPEFITIELQPKTNTAWHRVSNISHNPHLRLKVKCEQSLSSVIESVEKKWVPSSVRFRRELNLKEEWDRLPHLKLYPTSATKLQPFDLSLFTTDVSTLISFNQYLKINNEDTESLESSELSKKSAEKAKDGDPAKFLIDKLSDITSQLQGEGSNGTNGAEAKETLDSLGAQDTKSHDWISQAANGWTANNSTDMSVGCMYLLFGSPDRLVLNYEWPELEKADEVFHMFAGMINRLITIAENEFGFQTNKKKMLSNAQTSPTATRSPTSRGRKPSPSTPKSTPSLVPLKPGPAKDSPEFKKPGVPLQSENRQLADAIALGHQELRPYARRLSSRPKLVQKNILPNRIAVPIATHLPYPLHPKPIASNTTTTSAKTHVMDISCITTGANMKYGITSKSSTNETASAHSTTRRSLQSMLSGQDSREASCTPSKTELINTLSQLLNHAAESKSTANDQLSQLQAIISNAMTSEESQGMESTEDILAQAMASIKTPVKRRITPTMISSTVEGTAFPTSTTTDDSLLFPPMDTGEEGEFSVTNSGSSREQNALVGMDKFHHLSESISEHSLSSLLNSITAGSNLNKSASENASQVLMDTDQIMPSDSAVGQSDSLPNSFKGLLSSHLGKDNTTSGHTGSLSSNTADQIKDAWLTPDITLSDFSLSSLLGDKSPRRNQSESSVQLTSGMLMSDRPPSMLGSDDTRLSFLAKLDVNELGMADSSLSNMLGGDSVDYMAKFESLASSLDTPQKKPG